MIGGSNRFAHAAAVAVAEAPAKAYNPLFIYGESGLGKTHLLHAIGHYAESLYPGIRVRYVSSEEFTNDFINSIANNRASVFQSRYREIDILLIDDIQFLQGKDSTQEAFFHTFNTLHDHNKQVVITSDLPPKHLTGFAWHHERDAKDMPIYKFTAQLATLEAPPTEMQQLLAVVQGNQQAMDQFVSVISGVVSPADYFSQENVGSIFAADAASAAAPNRRWQAAPDEPLCRHSRSRSGLDAVEGAFEQPGADQHVAFMAASPTKAPCYSPDRWPGAKAVAFASCSSPKRPARPTSVTTCLMIPGKPASSSSSPASSDGTSSSAKDGCWQPPPGENVRLITNLRHLPWVHFRTSSKPSRAYPVNVLLRDLQVLAGRG